MWWEVDGAILTIRKRIACSQCGEEFTFPGDLYDHTHNANGLSCPRDHPRVWTRRSLWTFVKGALFWGSSLTIGSIVGTLLSEVLF